MSEIEPNTKTASAPRRSNWWALLWIGLPVVAGGILVFFMVHGWPAFLDQDNGNSGAPFLSADGRYLVFASEDPGIVAGDDNKCHGRYNCSDVFVKDIYSGETMLVSTNSEGVSGEGDSGLERAYPVISNDGRYVVFGSASANFGAAMNITQNLYVKDLQTGKLTPIVESFAGPYHLSASYPAISGDGRIVAFWSLSKLVDEDTDEHFDVYVKDLSTGTLERVSVDDKGRQRKTYGGGDPHSAPSLSEDGRYVAFGLDEYQPVHKTNVSDNRWQIFVKDRKTRELHIASSTANAEPGDEDSHGGSISSDGRFIVFASSATNLVTGKSCQKANSSCPNIYLKDMRSGEIKLISTSASGETMDNAGNPVISGDSRFVAYVSSEYNMPSRDMQEIDESYQFVKSRVYIWDREKDESLPVNSDDGDLREGSPTISANGHFVGFTATSSLASEDRKCETHRTTPGFLGIRNSAPEKPCKEVYVKDMQTGELTRVSSGFEE